MSEVEETVSCKNASIYPRICKKCQKLFKSRHAFWNHRVVCSGSVIICEGCGHVYRSRLAFHEHNCQNRKNGKGFKKLTNCIAPDCERKFFRRTEMLKHIEAVHSNSIEESVLNFISVVDFEKWKETESEKSFTYFRKQRGTKKIKDAEYTSFICQFDAPNRKKGSKIPNYSCPARMQVSKNANGQVSVRYISTHNHPLTQANLKYQPYPKTVVNYIKNLLINGSEPKTVFKILKNRINDPDFLHLKDHSITIKYINNIKYQLKIKGELNVEPLETRFNHKQSAQIPLNNIKKTSNSTWSVASNDRCFTVEQFHPKCPQPDDCLYRCFYSTCNGLCSHLYTCTCPDGSLCKHIHKIQSLYCTKNKSEKTKDTKIVFEEHDFISQKSHDCENIDYIDVPQEMIMIENIDSQNGQETHFNDQIRPDKIAGTEENYRSVGEDLLSKLASVYKDAYLDFLPEMNLILKNAFVEFSKLKFG